MLKKLLSKISKYLPQILASLFLVAFAVYGWTEPSVAPPGGNVATPINTGSVEQIKTGNLTVNALGISASGNALLVPNGNVGIGTASPQTKLDVSGNIKITDGTQGAGKVLTSDSSGLATWKDPIPPGTLMGEWWVSGNPLPLCYSDPGCSVAVGVLYPAVTISVNNNSVNVLNCPYWFVNFQTCELGSGLIYAKCASGLTEKTTIVHPATAGSNMIVRNICTK